MMAMPITRWPAIDMQIRRKSRGPEQERMNLIAGRALFDGLRNLNANTLKDDFIKKNISLSHDHYFGNWLPYLVASDASPKLVVPIVDFRTEHGLTEPGRKFAFSMMNVAIRGSGEEYEQAQFLVLRLKPSKFRLEDDRKITLERQLEIHIDPEDYYRLEDLEDYVDRIYRIFSEVLTEEQRKAA